MKPKVVRTLWCLFGECEWWLSLLEDGCDREDDREGWWWLRGWWSFLGRTVMHPETVYSWPCPFASIVCPLLPIVLILSPYLFCQSPYSLSPCSVIANRCFSSNQTPNLYIDPPFLFAPSGFHGKVRRSISIGRSAKNGEFAFARYRLSRLNDDDGLPSEDGEFWFARSVRERWRFVQKIEKPNLLDLGPRPLVTLMRFSAPGCDSYVRNRWTLPDLIVFAGVWVYLREKSSHG